MVVQAALTCELSYDIPPPRTLIKTHADVTNHAWTSLCIVLVQGSQAKYWQARSGAYWYLRLDEVPPYVPVPVTTKRYLLLYFV